MIWLLVTNFKGIFGSDLPVPFTLEIAQQAVEALE